MKRLAAYSGYLPPIAAVSVVCLVMGRWLWDRWFSVGGEATQGYLFALIVAATTGHFISRRTRAAGFAPDFFSLVIAGVFFISVAAVYRGVPRMISACLLMSAFYWSIRSSMLEVDRQKCAALWPLLLMSLPYEPSLQFVLGYPLRSIAARLAAMLLPGGVTASGCVLTDGNIEVFIDAPCAGAGMLSGMLTLAAAASLIFCLNGRRTALLMLTGIISALISNAFRAALLYAGYAELLPVKFYQYESSTGIFCFAAGGILLAFVAFRLRKDHQCRSAPKTIAPGSGGFMASGARRNVVSAIFFIAACVSFILASLWPTGASSGNFYTASGASSVRWPTAWEEKTLIPAPPNEATELFRARFPGEFREFLAVDASDIDEGLYPETARVVLRFVRSATRQLHPAEDCFRGAGYKINPLPLRLDENNRRWSGFIGEKSGYRVVVRQCVISAPYGDLTSAETESLSWPDVSSWYWDVARPGAKNPPAALAVTVVNEI
jgi:exosortase/archaeosortase family protein